MYQNDTLNNPVYPTRAWMKTFLAFYASNCQSLRALYIRALSHPYLQNITNAQQTKRTEALQEGPGAPFISQPI